MRKNNKKLHIRYSEDYEKALNEMEKAKGVSKTTLVKKAIKAYYITYRAEKASAVKPIATLPPPPPKLEKQETEREKMEREDLEDMYRRISASES